MPNIVRKNRSVGTLIALVFLAVGVSAQETELIAGQNINMVSGTEWPTGDPYLQRQNEPTIAVSTRNAFHLMGGSNDYRTIDLPFLPGGEGKTVGDSWISAYFSTDGGGRWTSTLLPGYPQDTSKLGESSPLKLAGYEASADPVIRAGTHGLFYYSGIAFTRGDTPPSAGFVATYMDLNNDERKNAIGYVRTTIFDENLDGTSFIDKPWIAVDKPRTTMPHFFNVQFEVETDTGSVVLTTEQTVECGNVYVAYARIQGDGSAAIRSQIMFTRSTNCGESFSLIPTQLSLPNTINQGAAVAIDPDSGHIQVAWRQFENATMNCTRKAKYWRKNPEAWPVDELELAGRLFRKEDGGKFVKLEGDEDDEHETEEYDDHDFDDDADKPSGLLRQLLAAWLNALSGADSSAVSLQLEEAEAWLVDHPPGTKPEKTAKRAGDDLRKILRNYNKGKIGPGKCDDKEEHKEEGNANGMLGGMNENAIMVVTSIDGGDTFSAPVAASGPNYFPFEQGTTPYAFRTTGFPTMTFDGVGRSHIAYTTRGFAIPDSDTVGGDSRIVVTTSMNGTDWTPPQPIDEPSVPGHQIMPAFEFSRGQLFLLYYDFREDVSGVFDRFITDLPVDLTTPRHSADVRVAQADAKDAAVAPVFTDYSVLDGGSTQTSRYPFLILDNAGMPFSQQMLYNPPNLPMFKGGTVPFFGDYIDIAALRFIRDEMGEWEFDTNPEAGAPVVHAVWTDNRDVVGPPPPDFDWASYVPPGDEVVKPSTFDPTLDRPVCAPDFDFDRTKMRNQNIYTSRLTQGLAAAVPGNNRQLGTIQRVFVGFIQNLTGEDKLFHLQIVDPLPFGVIASFDQFTVVTQRDEVVERNSSISRSIYVTSTNPSASVDISVVEVENMSGTIVVVPGGLTATLRINPDPSAPVPDDSNILAEEIYTPAIFNPAIFNLNIDNPAIFNDTVLNPAIFNPAIFNNPEQADFVEAALMQLALLNPAIFNPAIFNPAIFNLDPANPAIFNPAIFNPAIFNPAIFNPAIFNPAIFNPAIFNLNIDNPAIFNPAIFNDAITNPAIFNSTVESTVVVKNEGNATAAYSLNLDVGTSPPGFVFQLMIYRTYFVPSVDGCKLTEEIVQESLVNELMPDVEGSLLNPDSTSFYVAPGDNVVVTLRAIPHGRSPGDPSTIDVLAELNLSQSIVPQAVDTAGLENGETEPKAVVILAPLRPPLVIVTTVLPDGKIGVPYLATLSTSGGGGDPVIWSVVPGAPLPLGASLSINGQISGTPNNEGVFNFAVRANDGDEVAEQSLSITVTAAAPSGSLISLDDPVFGVGSLTLDTATGLEWLDLGFSVNRSFNDVSSNLGTGGDFEGFRYATAAELITFYTNAGIIGIDTNIYDAANFGPVSNLLSLTGTTCPVCGPGPASVGMVTDIHTLGGRRVSFFVVNTAEATGTANILISGRQLDGATSLVVASHLVRLAANQDAGNALAFDGLGDVVKIPHHSSLSLQALTVETWVRIESPDFFRRPLISKGSDFGNYTLAIIGAQTEAVPGTPEYVHRVATGNFSTGGTPIQFGTWTHVAATYSGGAGGTAKFFVNGQLVGSGISTLAPLENIEDIFLGRAVFQSVPDQFHNGLLDEVRIWNVVRSPQDIADNFNRSIAIDTDGLVGYWKFDEAINDQNVFDSSPLGNNGTLGIGLGAGSDDPQRIVSTAPLIP